MELFTLAQARELMPEVQRRSTRYVDLRADFAEAGAAVRAGDHARAGGLAELKSLEARVHEELEWFRSRNIQVKGVAPLLIDFPAMAGDRQILLCWLEGEPQLRWYHPVELGFMGRRRIDDLTAV